MRIAAIGDIHGFWDDADTDYFNASDYDALLFVGDLPRLTGGLDVARKLAQLSKPAWLIPGNHDGCTTAQLLSEMKGWQPLCHLTGFGMARRVRRLAQTLGPVRLAGFEAFNIADDLGLIVARPHAMGPDRFYYRHYLRRHHGVDSFDASAEKLIKLVDQAPQKLIFLAHNGPAGLGDKPQDIWGCDFSPAFGDFGDPDLRCAVAHAQHSGRQVLAVIGGHMHLRSRSGERRRAVLTQDNTLYINAAEVARIRKGGTRRHHVQLNITQTGVQGQQVWVDKQGTIIDAHPFA